MSDAPATKARTTMAAITFTPSGETIEVVGGRYEMTTELTGYEPYHQTIEVRIGKPYTYFVPMVAEKGRLEVDKCYRTNVNLNWKVMSSFASPLLSMWISYSAFGSSLR